MSTEQGRISGPSASRPLALKYSLKSPNSVQNKLFRILWWEVQRKLIKTRVPERV